MKERFNLGLNWLLAYETQFLLPAVVKKLIRIRKGVAKIPNSDDFKQRLRKARSKCVLGYARRKKRIFIRLVLFTLIFMNRKGALRKMVREYRKAMRNPKKKFFKSKGRKNEQRNPQLVFVSMCIQAGIRENLKNFLSFYDIVPQQPSSILATYQTESNGKVITLVSLNGQEPAAHIPAETFKNYQALFSNKMQMALIRAFSQNGPFKFLKKFSNEVARFTERAEAESNVFLTNGILDMLGHARKMTKNVRRKRKRARRALIEKLERPIHNMTNKNPKKKEELNQVSMPLNVTRTKPAMMF